MNKLDSVVHILPYEYNRCSNVIILNQSILQLCDYSFDFCQASEDSTDRDPVENLGQVVFGERLRASPYEVVCYC